MLPVTLATAGGGELLVLVERLLALLALVFVLLLVFVGCVLDDWVDDEERPWLDLDKMLNYRFWAKQWI